MQNYKRWSTIVPDTNIIMVEKNNCSKFVLSNVTNILGTASGTDDLMRISFHQKANFCVKETRSSTASKVVYSDPASGGIAYSKGSSPYGIINSVGISVTSKKLTLTLPANSPLLSVGMHVRMKNLNDAGKAAAPYMDQVMAIVSKTSDTVYSLGAIVPSSVTIAGGSTATVETLGYLIPSENAHPFLISKRSGSYVTLTMSISEKLFQINSVAQEGGNSTYHLLISGNHPMLNRKQEERVQLLVQSISQDKTGTVVVLDDENLINESYSVKPTDRVAIESGTLRSVRASTDYIFFTDGLKAGDVVEIETYCSQT